MINIYGTIKRPKVRHMVGTWWDQERWDGSTDICQVQRVIKGEVIEAYYPPTMKYPKGRTQTMDIELFISTTKPAIEGRPSN
jgi:hypothetical protein